LWQLLETKKLPQVSKNEKLIATSQQQQGNGGDQERS